MKAAGRFSMKVITDGTGAGARDARRHRRFDRRVDRRATSRSVTKGFGGGFSLPKADALAMLAPLLTDPSIEKIGHDLKADLIVLGRHGVDVSNPNGFDTMLASYLVDANRSSQALEPIALEQLGYKALTEDEVRGKGVKATAVRAGAGRQRARLRRRARRPRAAAVASELAPVLIADELESVYRDLELPLVPILADIERTGVRVDVRVAGRRSQSLLDRELSDLSRQIFALAGGEFNIGSPKQLAEILFEKLQLPVLKRTGTSRAPSTAVEVLEELAAQHDICRVDPRLARLCEAEGHLHRRAAAAGQPGDGPRAHADQPGGGGDRPPQQQRSQPAEHSDPHRDRPRRFAARSSPIPATC